MVKTLVTSYVNPDLDGVACAIAYGEFLQKTGRDVIVGVMGEPHDEAKYVMNRFAFEYPSRIENADDFQAVIIVDVSDLNGLENKIAPEKVIEIIDHRKVHEATAFINAKVQIELVGSAATLVAERFMKAGIEMSKASATLLYSAIVSNTLNFKGSVTTDRDLRAAEWLNGIAKLSENFWQELFAAKSDLSGGKLAERIVGDFAWFTMGTRKVGIAQLEILGAKRLIAERSYEITKVLDGLKSQIGLDMVFLNIIELENCTSILVAADVATQQLLQNVLHVEFVGLMAEKAPGLMRKQIVPLLKQELETR